ncbi:hypothetical protein C1645_877979 [Glomus cerebriforme]|uniref:Uncharacterized protein n=1 Tax=Glomus cerebriforme TaxID=658196 RepID=A0A397SUB8_9GLOM|nr:hypothetical protein C1645_877979 [Glomus cerebriforme]
MAQDLSEETITDYQQSNYDDINLNIKLAEELKISETLCNQLKIKYESLGKYCEDLQNNYNNINNILSEKQELKKPIFDLNQTNDHNSKLIKVLVETIEEKKKEIQEKDKTIQEKENKIQEIFKEIKGKDKTIQGKDNQIQEILKEIKGKDKTIQEKDNQNQKIIKEIKGKNKTIQEKDNQIQEIFKDIQERDKEMKIQVKYNAIQEKDKVIQDLNKVIQELEELKSEASKYKYALGPATNFRLSDDDKNNSVTFKNDILILQHSLENYITKCKVNVDINVSEIQKLLKKYKSNSVITKDNKPLIRAVLQRHVIEQIFEYGEKYFHIDNLNDYKRFESGIETHLYKRTNELIDLADAFARKRDGGDDTTKVLPIKLRQLIYAALGNRGFNNYVSKNNFAVTHDFIKKYKDTLNKEISKYRTFKDSKRKIEIEDMAGDIIKKVVTLFWFRFKVQEPIAEEFWFNYKDKINPSCMEGKWEEDDIDNIVVDICYFPLIANKSTRQIYTFAKIYQTYKKDLTNG